MFSKAIYSTTLTSEVADRLFSNTTTSGALDHSFLATLRALLRKRLPQHERVQLTCRALFQSLRELEYASVSNCFTWFLQNAPLHPLNSVHHIHIIYTVDPDAGAKMLEIIKGNAGIGKRYMTEYTRQDDLHVFFARKTKALFYTHTSGNSTIIFTDKLELKHFHALQMMIPKYLPRLFADNPLCELEANLLKSTGNRYASEYEALIEEFTKDLDIRLELIRSRLAGFENVFERLRVNEVRDEISRYQHDYDTYLSILRDTSNKIQECKYTLAGLECALNGPKGDSELMEYFICNKSLSIIKVMGTAIEFIVNSYADVYDVEAFEQYAGNYNGFLYNNLNVEASKPQMEKLYRAIFSERKYKLRMCAAYRADMRTGLSALKHYDFPLESQTYLPNPHIQSHGCLGTYAGRFLEYVRRKDYVGAIDQAATSARNLNFYDSAVMSAFAFELSCSMIKCLEKSDGSLLTPYQAIVELEGGTVCHDL